jgi:hypothetical protein
MRLEFSRLRWPEWVVGFGGLVLLASLLLMPWYTLILVSGPPGPKYFSTRSVDGWHGLTHARWLVLVTILAALAVMLLQARQRAPALPIALTVFAVPLALLTLVWLIVRFWISPPGGRGIGGWIGLLSTAAILYGGCRSIRLEGIAAGDAPTEIPTVRVGGEGSTPKEASVTPGGRN